MTTPLERLTDGQVLVADGAMGTLLIEHGLEPGRCPELINLERPELLREIAARYLEAGADIVHTNTFGASPLKLAQFGLDDRTEEINRQAVRAARAAIGDRGAFISASCGPCGRLLEPYPLLQLRQAPSIEVRIHENGRAIKGVGEAATPTAAPALGNAIFAATGKRIRELPFRKSVRFV